MDERLKDITQRWTFPGHHFADYTEQQVDDVRYLLDLIKQHKRSDELYEQMATKPLREHLALLEAENEQLRQTIERDE